VKGYDLLPMTINMVDIFSYSFMWRACIAGGIVALIAPLIGMFFVLRRYSMITDTISHLSLAGVALGLVLGIHPLVSAVVVSLIASVGVDRIRSSTKIYGDSILAILLSSSLAVAVLLMGMIKGIRVDIASFLFGSIITVSYSDLIVMAIFALIVLCTMVLFYKEFVFITFDEDSAFVSGIPTKLLNMVFIAMAAFTVAIAIPVVGVLLISALSVIPVIIALSFQKRFITTIWIAQGIALFSVIFGIVFSFYANTATGATIVIVTMVILILRYVQNKIKRILS